MQPVVGLWGKKDHGAPGFALNTYFSQARRAVDIEEVIRIPSPYDLQVWVEDQQLCSEDIAGIRIAVGGSTLGGAGHQHFLGRFHGNVAVRQTADLVIKLVDG